MSALCPTIKVLLLLTFTLYNGADNYCELNCGQARHTLCKYKPCAPSTKRCGTSFEVMPLSEKEKEFVLEEHNRLRNLVNTPNKYSNVPFGPKMKVMAYSLELEFIAQCYANMCHVDGNHDECRQTKEFASVSQNAYSTNVSSPSVNRTMIIMYAIQDWLKEYKLITAWSDFKNDKPSNEVSNFVNMVKDTNEVVGCGRTYYRGMKSIVTFICNYGPGFTKGVPLITAGPKTEVCSNCKCDKKLYRRLCVSERSPGDWRPPFLVPRIDDETNVNKLYLGKANVHFTIMNILLPLFAYILNNV